MATKGTNSDQVEDVDHKPVPKLQLQVPHDVPLQQDYLPRFRNLSIAHNPWDRAYDPLPYGYMIDVSVYNSSDYRNVPQLRKWIPKVFVDADDARDYAAQVFCTVFQPQDGASTPFTYEGISGLTVGLADGNVGMVRQIRVHMLAEGSRAA